jgi:signal transduction histidine kinase
MKEIAVVEREAILALDIVRSLERAGFKPKGPFDTAAQFLDSIDMVSWSLALVDIQGLNPEVNIRAAEEARKRGGPPCVFIVSHLDKSIFDLTKPAEPLGLIVMPFSERELVGTIEIALFRAELERRIRLSERRYRDLFMHSLSARCVLDSNGTIVEKNPAFDNLFIPPVPKEIIPGTRKASEFDPDITRNPSITLFFNDANEWSEVKDMIMSGRIVTSREIRMIDHAGNRLSVLASFSPLQVEAAQESSMLCEFVDLSESRKLREELYQAQKMDAMGRLAAGVAHDFNNILTAIIGHAEMMKMDLPPGEPVSEDLEGVFSASRKAASITKQLLAFSRKKDYSPIPADVFSIVRESVKMLKRLAGESILFSTVVGDGTCIVFSDPVQIEQALINLVVNARDALEGKQDGRIQVIASVEELLSQETIGGVLLPPGRYATIEVSDNGRGIPEELTAKIFEPFFTTKTDGKGTGLGLAIVLSIMTRSRGTIGIESTEGAGTTMKLWFPERNDLSGMENSDDMAINSVAGDLVPKSLQGRLPHGVSILLVDDDEDLLGFLSGVLEIAGAVVLSARNAGEAILRSEAGHCDALVTDIVMPGMSGIDLAVRLEKNFPGLPVLFMTGKIPDEQRYSEKNEIPLWVRNCPILDKPFTPNEFVNAASKLLEKAPHR